MPLRTLVVGCDSPTLEQIVPVLNSCAIQTKVCTDLGTAMQHVACEKYEGFVVESGAAEMGNVVEAIRRSRSNRSSIVFALVDPPIPPASARSAANFVLQKGLSPERLLQTVRAAHGLMLREHRRYFRVATDLTVSINILGSTPRDMLAVARNISQSGMEIEHGFVLAPNSTLNLDFQLDGNAVDAQAQVMWAREHRAGMRMYTTCPKSRAAIDTWVQRNWENAEPAARLPVPIPSGAHEDTAARQLLRHAFINNLPVEWKCSACKWRQSIRVSESSWTYESTPPAHILAAFIAHVCG